MRNREEQQSSDERYSQIVAVDAHARFRVYVLPQRLLPLQYKLLIEFRSDFLLDMLLEVLYSVNHLPGNLVFLLSPLFFLIESIVCSAIGFYHSFLIGVLPTWSFVPAFLLLLV